MTNALMIDTETWGARPGCALRSIGAVWFDAATFQIRSTFLANITLDDQLALGLHQDPSTVAWWNAQSPEARGALDVDPLPLDNALQRLSAFMVSAEEEPPALWAWGAAFDFPILGAAIRAAGLPQPWAYRQERCARTICAEVGVRPRHTEGLTHHNALDDCRAQVGALIEATATRFLRIRDNYLADRDWLQSHAAMLSALREETKRAPHE